MATIERLMNESLEARPNKLDDEVKMPRSFSVLFDKQNGSHWALSDDRCESQGLLFGIQPEICHPCNFSGYVFLAVLQP